MMADRHFPEAAAMARVVAATATEAEAASPV
jgi:hypothetical protein